MIIQVLVKPGAKKDKVLKMPDGTFKVSVKARPVEGKANEAVRETVAEYFNVSRSKVVFLKGMKSKYKRLDIN